MASKPTVKQILTENLPTTKDFAWLVPSLVSPLNLFMDQVSRALNRRLTITENMDGDIKTVTLDGVFPVRIAWDRMRPKSVLVGAWAQLSGTTTAPTAAVGVDWTFNQASEIQIDAVYGITPASDKKYQLTLQIHCG
jgi:hypothetical protein